MMTLLFIVKEEECSVECLHESFVSRVTVHINQNMDLRGVEGGKQAFHGFGQTLRLTLELITTSFSYRMLSWTLILWVSLTLVIPPWSASFHSSSWPFHSNNRSVPETLCFPPVANKRFHSRMEIRMRSLPSWLRSRFKLRCDLYKIPVKYHHRTVCAFSTSILWKILYIYFFFSNIDVLLYYFFDCYFLLCKLFCRKPCMSAQCDLFVVSFRKPPRKRQCISSLCK